MTTSDGTHRMHNQQQWDALWVNVHLATMADSTTLTDLASDYGGIRDAAIAVKNSRIAWLGRREDLPPHRATIEYDGKGRWMTPGLIDCHTHIVFAGSRADEFEARLNGASYEDIARRGGGILSTVRATRDASEQVLYAASLQRVSALLSEGVTTLEIKSGYGLDLDTERKMLRVARRIGHEFPVHVRTTFLGAHALPPEYAGRPDAYIDHVCQDMLPTLAAEGLIDAVDAFCEHIGFSAAQTAKVFSKAKQLGLPVKLHAEQLSDQDGAALTATHRGLSADHLEHVSAKGIAAMKESGTVAVLLPGAFYFLRETKLPPVQALRDAGVPIAVATDCNPGTSPMTSLLLAMNMACTFFRMTPLEALQGTTKHAAQALGMAKDAGTLEIGKRADMVLWEINSPGELAYAIGGRPSCEVVWAGRPRKPDFRPTV
jgi:imidazolonepropionase